MVDYSLAWFKEVCEAEGLSYDNILVANELDRARGYAYEVKWWRNQARLAKRVPTDETKHWLYHEKTKLNAIREFEYQAEWHNQKRIECMLDALDMAVVVKGFDPGFGEYLNREYTKDGLTIPKF